jgi:hypothetical protein
MTHGLLSGGFIVGIVVGFLAGSAFTVARRAWRDHGMARTVVPKLRQTAWGVTGAAVGWVVVVGVLMIAAVGWAASSVDSHGGCGSATASSGPRTDSKVAPARAAAGPPSASPTACH